MAVLTPAASGANVIIKVVLVFVAILLVTGNVVTVKSPEFVPPIVTVGVPVNVKTAVPVF